MSVLCYPGALERKHINLSKKFNNDLLMSFDKTLKQLIENRKKEGLLLKEEIIKRLQYISKEINDIKNYVPDVIQKKGKVIKLYI